MDVVDTYPSIYLPHPNPRQTTEQATAILGTEVITRLKAFKHRYNLTSDGFTDRQAKHLLFVKALYVAGLLDS